MKVIGIDGLEVPGDCPWWTDWFFPRESHEKSFESWAAEEMWICILSRAAMASAWWASQGNEVQRDLWNAVFKLALSKELEYRIKWHDTQNAI